MRSRKASAILMRSRKNSARLPVEVSKENLLDGYDSRQKGFPEGIGRSIVFEMPDRLTDVVSWHGHIPFAFWIVEALRPDLLVELGTHKGDSYCAFAQAIDRLRLGTACYAIDTWRGDKHSGFYGEEVFEELRQYHEPRYGRFSRLIRSTFDDALHHFADGSIDLLHIDGLHTYEALRHDFESWRPKLSSRAVVLFHDINVRELDFGVWRFWNQVVTDYPSFTFRHSHGLGLLAVGADVAEPVKRLTRYDDSKAEQVRIFFSRLGGALVAYAEAPAKRAALAAAESKLSERDRQNAELAEALQLAQSARDDAHSGLVAVESKLSERDRQNAELAEALQLAQSARDDAHSALGTAESKLSARDRYNAELSAEVCRAAGKLQRTREELQRTLAGLEALKTETQVLGVATESLKADRESLRSENEALKPRAQLQADANAILRSELHNLWNSWSWGLFRPLRNFIRKRQGFGKEAEPTLDSEPQLIQTVITIRQSLSWELTAPLRLIYRILPRRRRFTPAGASPMVQQVGQVADEGLLDSQPSPSSHWDELIARGAVLPWRNGPVIANRSPVGASGNPRILFVSHEATRTGAPLILLTLLRHFAQTGRYELFVFCDAGGPLLEAFAEYAHVIHRPGHDVFGRSPTIDDLIRDFGTRLPLVAICNTSVVNHYAIAFKRFGIPVVTLVHEVADQFAEGHFREIYEASDRVVFPAEFVRNSAEANGWLPKDKVVVIPQGLLDPDFAGGIRDEARQSVRQELGIPKESFVVLACGTLDLRKGVDLFVSLANAVLTKTAAPIHFVWLGADVFGLARWVRKDATLLGISDRVHLLGARDAAAPFFQAADVFVLTSREDPFPCVVLEAMAAGTPVVAFHGAGGAPEALEEGSGISVGYRDIDAMAAAILNLHQDPRAAERLAQSAKTRVSKKYRFQDYYRALVRLIEDEIGVPLETENDADLKLAPAVPSVRVRDQSWQERDFFLIKEDNDFDSAFFLGPYLPRDEAIKLFIREWATLGRKPCSGFNPQIYAERALQPNERDIRNPFAHYIEKGKPAGPWQTQLIREAPGSARATRLRMAVHVHAHYPDLMDELLRCLAENSSKCDLYVSTSRKEELGLLRRLLASYDKGEVRISVVPNRGRDIGPFVTEYNWLSENYDLIGHLHTKKSLHVEAVVGETWRKFLWRSLVGEGYAMMDLIAKHFEGDAALGLVFPDDPNIVGWWANKDTARQLAQNMGLKVNLPQAFEFPVGTMFWCRPMALRPLFELGLSWDDYPPEPLPIDGTILHAIERLLPFIAQHEGYRIASSHVTGVVRGVVDPSAISATSVTAVIRATTRSD